MQPISFCYLLRIMQTSELPAFLTIAQVAEMLNITKQTLRNWDKQGVHLTPVRIGRTRHYRVEDVLNFAQTPLKSNAIPLDARAIAIYGRVSSHEQKSDLMRQLDYLKQYALHYYPDEKPLVFSDIASGLNLSRRQFSKLVDKIQRGEIRLLLINYKDRLMRFGFPLFEQLCAFHKVELRILNDKSDVKTFDEEITADILSLVTSLSGKYHAARKKQNKALLKDKLDATLCN